MSDICPCPGPTTGLGGSSVKAPRVEGFCLDLLNCEGLCFVDMRGILEEELLRAALHRFGGNLSEISRELCVSRSWLHELLKRHEIRRSDYETDYQGTESEKISKETEEFIDLIMNL